MSLGERIYQYRKAKGMSQDALAELLDVSRQSVSKWENDTAQPELSKLTIMCDLFGVSLDELARGKQPQPAAQPESQESQGSQESQASPESETSLHATKRTKSLQRTLGIGLLLLSAFQMTLLLVLRFQADEILILLLPLLLAVPALALDSYELFARWEQDGYPEDVTGVFYNTETKCLAVVLTENTEARQKELRDTLTDGETLTFFAGEYSHAQLAECAAAITKDMEENGLAGTVSIGWGANGGYGPEGKDFRVVIKTETAEVAALTERYAEYDSMVAVEENTEPVVPDAPVEPEKQGLSDWGIIGIAAIVAVMLIIVITVAGNKKRARKNGEHGNIQL